MVRTHSAALADSTGFAMLRPASRPQLDATRMPPSAGRWR